MSWGINMLTFELVKSFLLIFTNSSFKLFNVLLKLDSDDYDEFLLKAVILLAALLLKGSICP